MWLLVSVDGGPPARGHVFAPRLTKSALLGQSQEVVVPFTIVHEGEPLPSRVEFSVPPHLSVVNYRVFVRDEEIAAGVAKDEYPWASFAVWVSAFLLVFATFWVVASLR